MEREYEVTGARGYRPPGASEPVPQGKRFKTDAPLPNEDALVGGGHLAVVSDTRLPCPACAEQDKTKSGSKTPRFETHEELAAHYASDHAGLAVPADIGEEA